MLVTQSQEDDVMMSSGDKPDDAELTDGDSTGNSQSNVGGQFLYAQIGPIIRLYMPIDSSNKQATSSLVSFYLSYCP